MIIILHQMCAYVCAGYVENVLAGSVLPDSSIGRQLTKMVNQVPKMPAGQFEEMLNVNMKVSQVYHNASLFRIILIAVLGS